MYSAFISSCIDFCYCKMAQFVATEMTKPLSEEVIEKVGGFVPMEKFLEGVMEWMYQCSRITSFILNCLSKFQCLL